jgi:hypothetical protein
MQINSNIENNTLIEENPAIRKKIEIRIKYTEEHANL